MELKWLSIQENIHISLPRSLKVNGHTAVVVIFSLQEVWSSSSVIITVLLLFLSNKEEE